MNKRLYIFASSFICLSLILSACNQSDQHEDNKKEQKQENKISEKEFNKLPYNQYYKKSDLSQNAESNKWEFKSDKIKKKVTENIMKEGSNSQYSHKKDGPQYFIGEGTINPDYNIKKDQKFMSPVIDINVTNSKIYHYDDVVKNKLSKDLPLKVDNSLGVVYVSSKDESQGEEHELDKENKGGIIKLDITVKNKSKHSMDIKQLTNVVSNKLDEVEPIVGRITVDEKTYSEKKNIEGHLTKQVKPNQEMNATIYYVVNDDIEESNLDLVIPYTLDKPFDTNEFHAVKVELK